MARTQSEKHNLLECVKPSNSTPRSTLRHSLEIYAESAAGKISGSSRGFLLRTGNVRRGFYGKTRHQPKAIATSTDRGADQEEFRAAFPKSTSKSAPRLDPEAHPTTASDGREVDAVEIESDGVDPMSPIAENWVPDEGTNDPRRDNPPIVTGYKRIEMDTQVMVNTLDGGFAVAQTTSMRRRLAMAGLRVLRLCIGIVPSTSMVYLTNYGTMIFILTSISPAVASAIDALAQAIMVLRVMPLSRSPRCGGTSRQYDGSALDGDTPVVGRDIPLAVVKYGQIGRTALGMPNSGEGRSP
ncbi:hypothetical protein EDD15DRAFT_2199760 [Pisolithus albus]|nr:hypothetical protein EDD15DRAFT_2199760 [Pisolithus albus]